MGGFQQRALKALLVRDTEHRFGPAAKRQHRRSDTDCKGAAPPGFSEESICAEDRRPKYHGNSMRLSRENAA
jgi:hypothetical protein